MGKGELDACDICFGCCVCFVIVFGMVQAGLSIAEIVIGAMYLHDCSLERMVPIYLIVSACAPILFSGLRKNEEDDCDLTAGIICGLIGFLFHIAWLICGSIWVYPTYATVHKDTYVPCVHVNGTYTPEGCTIDTCNDTLLEFSFAMVTINWVSIFIWLYLIGSRCNFKYVRNYSVTTTKSMKTSKKSESISIISW